MYKKKNGFFKFFNSDGKSCRIKLTGSINYPVRLLIKFKEEEEEMWKYHTPDKNFNSDSEILHHICKNLETDKLVFDIVKN